MNWEDMSEREQVDFFAVHVMGWESKRCLPYGTVWSKNDNVEEIWTTWNPLKFIDHTWHVEEKLQQMDEGTQLIYVANIIRVLGHPEVNGTGLLKMIHASPQDRCKAIYVTLYKPLEEDVQ